MRKKPIRLMIAILIYICFLNLTPEVHSSEIIRNLEKGCYTGVFSGLQTVFDFEKMVEKKQAIVLSFTDRWGPPYFFSKDYCKVLWQTNHLPLITWQPQIDIATINEGKWDNYISDWAQSIKEYSYPVMIRWGHEMNGNWYQWGGVNNGGGEMTGYGDPHKPDGPERYIDAYRYIHDFFERVGAKNVIWVWSPNEGNPIGESWNEIENYYPGDDYVNWLGMDGYNWGTSRSWSHWRSFDDIFSDLYRRLSILAPDKPIVIAEFASSEEGGNKAQWINDAFQKIKTAYPRIKVFIWFDIIKETSWAVDSSSASLEAFRKAMQDPYYVGELQVDITFQNRDK